MGVNGRTCSRSSFTTCASSSTQAWAANGLDRTPIAKRQGTPCRLSNAHVASDCTRQRSVSPNSHAAFLNAATASERRKGVRRIQGGISAISIAPIQAEAPEGGQRRKSAKRSQKPADEPRGICIYLA